MLPLTIFADEGSAPTEAGAVSENDEGQSAPVEDSGEPEAAPETGNEGPATAPEGGGGEPATIPEEGKGEPEAATEEGSDISRMESRGSLRSVSPAGGFDIDKPLGGGSISAGSESHIHIFGEDVEMTFAGTSSDTNRRAALQNAVSWLASNGAGKDYVMYLPGSGSSSYTYSIDGVEFAGLSDVRTLVITGISADPVAGAGGKPEPATANTQAGYVTLSGGRSFSFGCNVVFRNIRYSANYIYMNGHDLTLGHKSWATSATDYYGGAASGTVIAAGDGTASVTVWSTGAGTANFVGGMYTGTINGNVAITIHGTSGNQINVYGGGWGTSSTRAVVGGNVTTAIDGMATNGGGLGGFFGGGEYCNVTGKITSRISGPGRLNGNFVFHGAHGTGDVGTPATKDTADLVVDTLLDIREYQGAAAIDFIGANTGTGTINGSIRNVTGAPDAVGRVRYQEFHGGFIEGAGAFFTGSASYDSNTGKATVDLGSIEGAASRRIYGNITNEIYSGHMTGNYSTGAGGAGFVRGDIKTDIGTKGLFWGGANTAGGQTATSGWVDDITSIYTGNGSAAARNRGSYTSKDFVGGGGYPVGASYNDRAFVLVGNSEINMHNVRLRWTYASNYAGIHVGDSRYNLHKGMVDTAEGGGYRGYIHKGNTRLDVYGGQVNWFFTGGGWGDENIDGNASMEVYDLPRKNENGTVLNGSDGKPLPAAVINASMGGHYGARMGYFSGNADIVIHGGDFSGIQREGNPNFSPGPTNLGRIYGNTSMTMDLRGNRYGFKMQQGNNIRITAGRPFGAGATRSVGYDANNTMTLNILTDDTGSDLLQGADIYGTGGTEITGTRAGKLIVNINAPGSNLGVVYATQHSNIRSNALLLDTHINLVAAKSIKGLSAGSTTDNFNATIVSNSVAAGKGARLMVGPQNELGTGDILGEWHSLDPANGYPHPINVTNNGEIRNFTDMEVQRRLLVAQNGDVLQSGNSSSSTSNITNHYETFGDVKIHAGVGVSAAGFGVAGAGNRIIIGKFIVVGKGSAYVQSPGGVNQIIATDYDASENAQLVWLKSGTQSIANVTQTTWFGMNQAYQVITVHPTRGNAEKFTPVNLRGVELNTEKTFIGDNSVGSSGNGYGVCIPGAFYSWDVVKGEDGSSLGKIAYHIDGDFTMGTSKPFNGYLDVYGTSPMDTPSASGSIAIPSGKVPGTVGYPKFSFIPDKATGEWAKDLKVQRSDHFITSPNGLYDYHEFEQRIKDYDDAANRTRTWQSAASGRKTGTYDAANPDSFGSLPSAQNDKDFSFDITVDYTSEPELSASSIIVRESQAQSLVRDGGNDKTEDEIKSALRKATSAQGRPFFTDDIDRAAALSGLGKPLYEGELIRAYPIKYETHRTDGGAVSKTKTATVFVVPEDAEVTSGAALIAADATMFVKDAQGIDKQSNVGDPDDKTAIDNWTGAIVAVLNEDGGIDKVAPELEGKADKIAAISSSNTRSEVTLSYSYAVAGKTLAKEVKVRINAAAIDGTLWYDTGAGANAGNGKIDTDEKGVGAGKSVVLYAEGDTSLTAPIATADTDVDGKFILNKKPDGSPIPAGKYIIKYPPITGHSFVTASSDGDAAGTNVGGKDGLSRTIEIDLEAKQNAVSNAGYKKSVFIDPDDSEAFTKKLIGVSGAGALDTSKNEAVTSAPQTDEFTYRIGVKMPDDMFPYSTDAAAGGSVDIRDLMDTGLAFSGGNDDVKVTVTDSSGGAVIGLSPAIAWDAAAGTLSVKFAGAYGAVMSKLEGATVEIDIPAKLKATGDEYPASVTNSAQIYLNGAGDPYAELPDGNKPRVTVKGKIRGVLFHDIDGDGMLSVSEAAITGKTVTLYNADDSAFANPVETAITDSGGGYSFIVEPGTAYIIKAATPDSGYGYTKLIAAADRTDGNIYSDVGNDGVSKGVTTSRDKDGANLEKSVNAGYAEVAGNPPEIEFTEYPLVLTQSADSKILTAADLKAKMKVTDDIDNPTWDDTDVAANDLFKDTTAVPVGISQIDRHNIGVYKVSYTVTDSHGNTDTRIRAVVVTDGRYAIDVTDDGDDTNDIIIGARNFVAKASTIDGSQSQAASLSYAEAYDGQGDAKAVAWAGTPAGYVQSHTLPGDYPITWKADGYSASKTITATIVSADEVYPSDRNGQYAIAASHFMRNTAQAAAMLGADLDKNLISAADARVFKLVDDTDPSMPGNQPLPDKGIVVITRGSSLTGPFSAAPNTYPIDYGIEGIASHHSQINGLVSDGMPPLLTVTTPDEVALGSVYDAARYMKGVSATDPDGDRHGTPDPSDDVATDITPAVKYGMLTATASGAAFTEGAPVIATKAGVYTVDYRVFDEDGNRADARRVVVANDGSYVLGRGNILKANSFVTRLSDVTDIAGNIKSEIRSKSKAAAIDGGTGIPFDLDDNAVTDGGGYRKATGTYDITVTAPDAPIGTISKSIKGKVVDAHVIEEGPAHAGPASTDRYYVYGNHIYLTTSEAQAIKDAADYEAALLNALGAYADKVSSDGMITDANARVTSDDGFDTANGIYHIKVSDAGGHVTAELSATVSSGNGPVIAASPVPIVIDAVAAPGNLKKEQIFGGVTVKDAEDTNGVETAWDGLPPSGPQVEVVGGMPQVKAGVHSVTQITYRYTDKDGNPAEVSRAIVVNDGRYKIDGRYILEANSFIIGKSQVSMPYKVQILDKSNARAWKVDGTPVTAEVKNTSGYKDEIGSYGVEIGIENYADMTKQIEARVIDDSKPESGSGGHKGSNGDRYSIKAGNFRINLKDAKGWQKLPGAEYEGKFLSRSSAASYLRATQQPGLVPSGTPKLGSVRKKGTASTDFRSATLAEGDIFLAAFYVDEEPGTEVTVEVLVSNANAPVLTVPPVKVVSVGAVFAEGAQADTSPSYYQGVSASDVEDGTIPQAAISHDSPVDTSAEAVFRVTYSVTDSDHNTQAKTGVVLVGDEWVVVDGYAISAHDFTKRLVQVSGTETEAIIYAQAKAVDVRQTLDDGKPNPDLGKAVAVVVADDGGYPRRKTGDFNIKFAVQEAPGTTKTVTAVVTSGAAPTLTVPSIRRVPEGAGFNYMTEVTATDAEDGNLTAKVIHNTPVNTNSPGAYKVTYSVTDSDGNTVIEHGIVLVGTGWVVKGGYVLYAQDFAKKLSEVTGTSSEAIRFSKAMAVWIANTSSPEFGKYVSVIVSNNGGYKKAVGKYNITFAVANDESITKTIKATISDDTPKDPTYNPPKTPTPPKVVVRPPAVVVNPTAPTPSTAPVIIEQPAASPVVDTPPVEPTETVPETNIEPTEIPLAQPEPVQKPWHLIDLLLVIVTMILAFFLMAHALRRKSEYGKSDTPREKQIRLWGPLGLLLGIVSVIVLFITQDFTGPMAWIDVWMVLFAVISVVETLAVMGVTSSGNRACTENETSNMIE
jgi:hypothetical protein